MSTLPRPPINTSEKEFQEGVVTLARYCGWRVFHPYDSRRSEPGFPDLTMVRNGKLVFAELKVGKNKLTPEQVAWLKDLAVGGGNKVAVYIWKPENWDEIKDVLARKPARRRP